MPKHFLRRHGSAIISRSVYGAIVVTALLVGFADSGKSAISMIQQIAGSMAVIAAAEVYASLQASRLHGGIGITPEERKEAFLEGLFTFGASQVPIIVLALSALGLFSLQVAINVATGLAILLLAALGYGYGRLSGRTIIGSLGVAAVDASLGAALVAVKVFFH